MSSGNISLSYNTAPVVLQYLRHYNTTPVWATIFKENAFQDGNFVKNHSSVSTSVLRMTPVTFGVDVFCAKLTSCRTNVSLQILTHSLNVVIVNNSSWNLRFPFSIMTMNTNSCQLKYFQQTCFPRWQRHQEPLQGVHLICSLDDTGQFRCCSCALHF